MLIGNFSFSLISPTNNKHAYLMRMRMPLSGNCLLHDFLLLMSMNVSSTHWATTLLHFTQVVKNVLHRNMPFTWRELLAHFVARTTDYRY
uniref:Uncharacterized protein n=1 Tax=Pararge aegeria TaxID=116150 RepID=S4PBR4_9NEOP